eukprot:Gb_09373 [translate_table: standard]
MVKWINKITSKFLKPDKKTTNLVGDDKKKVNENMKHIVFPYFHSTREHIFLDVIHYYSSGGCTIIFNETKNIASELVRSLTSSVCAFHGDIQQSQCEVTKDFDGNFSILMEIDVVTRGLDINDIHLIIIRDVETYIDQSG